MRNKVLLITLVLTLLVTAAAFAADYPNPAEIIEGLKGVDQQEIIEQRLQGKRYGEIAEEYGVLDDFKKEMFQYKKDIIDERVEAGLLTEARGEALKKILEERITACDGTPDTQRLRLGLGFGKATAKAGGNGFGGGRGRMRMGFGRSFSD